MIIKVLGSGCTKCKQLEAYAQQAVNELGIEATIEKVTNIEDIVSYGVMRTPALVINEQVKVMGRVASTDEIKKLL